MMIRSAAASLLFMAISFLPQRCDSQRTRSRDLSGTWSVTLAVSPSELTSPSSEKTLTGFLDLHSDTAVRRYQALPTHWASHVGTFKVDLSSLGVRKDSSGSVLIAGSRRDSVEMVFGPSVDHGSLLLFGRDKGDKITGTWVLTAYAASPTGTFVLRRVRKAQRMK